MKNNEQTKDRKKDLNNCNSIQNTKRRLLKMSNKEVLLYLISKLGDKTEGRKKIMKMMFLINHFDISKNSLVKTPLLNENFIIYHYGVFSFDVMNNFLDLSHEEKVQGDFPIRVKTSEIKPIPHNIKERVDSIIERFGNESGRNLELNTLSYLGLNLETKGEHFGEPVTNFIK